MELTQEGLVRLNKELHDLKTVKRRELAERLKRAISFGDLSENAEYKEAKEAQGFLEGRILELSRLLAKAKVAQDREKCQDKITVGSKVVLKDEQGRKIELILVGAGEADLAQNRISTESPLGARLLGKRAGQEITLETPAGQKYFIIATAS